MKKIITNVWSVLERREQRRFLLLVGLDMVVSIADIGFLFLLLLLVQHYVQPDMPFRNAIMSWLQQNHSLWPVALFFILFSVKNLAGYWVTKSHFHLNRDVAIRVSENNLIKFQEGSFNDYVRIDSAEQVRKIAFQPFEFCQQLLSGLQQLITQLCLIVVAVIGILLFNPILFFLLLAVLLPPVIAVFYFIKKRLAKARAEIRVSNEASYRYLFDALKGYVEGNVFRRNSFFLRRFVNSRKVFSQHLFDTLSLQVLPSRVIEIFAVMGLFALIGIAEWTGMNDKTSLLTIGAFMAAAYKIIPGMVKIITLVGQIKAYEFTAHDYEKNSFASNQFATKQNHINELVMRDLSFGYSDVAAFQNLSLQVRRGDFVGVFGTSGRGKTTLLNVLLGFLPVQNGTITVNGKSVCQQQLQNLWPSIAYVRQQCFLLHDTVLRNITLSDDGYDDQRLLQALHLSGLEEMLRHSADGLEKLITENGKNISGGQQQRIALARALYKEADVYLLDEPFNELDETSETALLQHFRRIADSGKIVVMITHNLKATSYCTQTICLDEN